MNLDEMLRKRADLVTTKEAKEAEIEEVGKELKTLDEALIARYDADGMTSVKIPGLGNFILMTRTYASIKDEWKDGSGVARIKAALPDLVKETVNGQTLSAFVNEAKRSGQELPPGIEEVLKMSDTRFLQWRR